MKRTFLIIIGILLWASFANAQGKDYTLRHDSLYVFTSWEQMFDNEQALIVLNPQITAYSAYDIEFDGIKKELRQIINDEAIAVALGDSLWYINSKWLKKNFKGECKHMRDYVPLYFTGKIAFVQWGKTIHKWGVTDDDFDVNDYITNGELYLINFDNMMVEKIDSDKLIEILDIYPDLRRRYEMMHDYDQPYMISDFFLQYVQRLEHDDNVPYLF